MILLLDTGLLGELCHPKQERHRSLWAWLFRLLDDEAGHRVLLPEIADYELRRELLRLAKRQPSSESSLRRLDELGEELEYLPLQTETLRRAAELWADARQMGLGTAPMESIDADVILAAQARQVGGTVVTGNRKHLSRYVPVADWEELARRGAEPT